MTLDLHLRLAQKATTAQRVQSPSISTHVLLASMEMHKDSTVSINADDVELVITVHRQE